jgi:hypothetical protein
VIVGADNKVVAAIVGVETEVVAAKVPTLKVPFAAPFAVVETWIVFAPDLHKKTS